MQVIQSNFPNISVKEAKMLAKQIVVSRLTKDMYDNDNSPETVAARELENFVIGVCQLLEIKDAFIAEAGSAMDCEIKADIALELFDGTCIMLQVKSSESAAKEHLTKTAKHNNRKYPVPSVVWLKERNVMQLLSLLNKELAIGVSNDVKEAVSLAKKLKGKHLPLKMLNLSHKQIKALVMLKFAKVKADQIIF